MDKRMVASELVDMARGLVGSSRLAAGNEIAEGVAHIEKAVKVLRALSDRLSGSGEGLDLAREIRFVDRSAEQLTMMAMSLDDLRRKVK